MSSIRASEHGHKRHARTHARTLAHRTRTHTIHILCMSQFGRFRFPSKALMALYTNCGQSFILFNFELGFFSQATNTFEIQYVSWPSTRQNSVPSDSRADNCERCSEIYERRWWCNPTIYPSLRINAEKSNLLASIRTNITNLFI